MKFRFFTNSITRWLTSQAKQKTIEFKSHLVKELKRIGKITIPAMGIYPLTLSADNVIFNFYMKNCDEYKNSNRFLSFYEKYFQFKEILLSAKVKLIVSYNLDYAGEKLKIRASELRESGTNNGKVKIVDFPGSRYDPIDKNSVSIRKKFGYFESDWLNLKLQKISKSFSIAISFSSMGVLSSIPLALIGYKGRKFSLVKTASILTAVGFYKIIAQTGKNLTGDQYTAVYNPGNGQKIEKAFKGNLLASNYWWLKEMFNISKSSDQLICIGEAVYFPVLQNGEMSEFNQIAFKIFERKRPETGVEHKRY